MRTIRLLTFSFGVISRSQAVVLLALCAAFVLWVTLESFDLIDTIPSLPA